MVLQWTKKGVAGQYHWALSEQSDQVIDKEGEMDHIKVKSLCGDLVNFALLSSCWDTILF